MKFGGLTIEMTMLVLAVVLGIVQLVLAAQLANAQRGLRWAASSRDDILPPLAGVAGRADRAFRNYLETFVLFAAVELAVEVTARHGALTQWGSEFYVLGRTVYLPLYLSGIPLIRSVTWNLATLGIFMLLVGLVWP